MTDHFARPPTDRNYQETHELQPFRSQQLQKRPPPQLDSRMLKPFGLGADGRAMNKVHVVQVERYSENLSSGRHQHLHGQQDCWSACRMFLFVFGVVLVWMLFYDFRSLKTSAIVEQEHIIEKCKEDFFVNRQRSNLFRCTQPLENLEEKCHSWDKCRRRNPLHEVMNTSILMKVLGNSLFTLVESAGVAALVCGSVLACIYFYSQRSSNRDPRKHH